MHGSINVKSHNNTSKWQMGFNSAFKGLRWIFRTLEGVVGFGWSWLRIGTGGGHMWVM
jgi:hypothetical protein